MSGLPRSAHALITGGGRGIGRAIAAELTQAGATVTNNEVMHLSLNAEVVVIGKRTFTNLAVVTAAGGVRQESSTRC